MEALRNEGHAKQWLRRASEAQGVGGRWRALTRWSRSCPCQCRPSPSFWAAVPDSHLSSCNSWSPWSCSFGCNSGWSSSSQTTPRASLCFLLTTKQHEKQINSHSLQAALFISNKRPTSFCKFPHWLCPHSAVVFGKTNTRDFFIC